MIILSRDKKHLMNKIINTTLKNSLEELQEEIAEALTNDPKFVYSDDYYIIRKAISCHKQGITFPRSTPC